MRAVAAATAVIVGLLLLQAMETPTNQPDAHHGPTYTIPEGWDAARP